jgi:predicted nucleotidyltransferase
VNTQAPSLAPLFRSDTQALILASLFLNPERGFTTAELARVADAPYASAHREVRKLVDARLVRERPVGRALLLSARQDSAAFRPLSELLALTYGPEVVLARVLGAIRGITEAFIYGSYAARRAGLAGDAPVDIDVLIIGNPARARIDEASLEAERLLGREVNVRIVAEQLWREGADSFLDSLRSSPLVPLAMGVDGDDSMGAGQGRD